MKILILHSEVPDGAPIEEQDTLWQVAIVKKSLLGIADCETQSFNGDLSKLLDLSDYNVIFNLVESVVGSNRLAVMLPLYLESKKIPFTGCSANSIYLATDKIFLARYLKLNHVAVPKLLPSTFISESIFQPDQLWIKKARYEDGSVGIVENSVVNRKDIKIDLSPSVYFYEEYLSGAEYSVSFHPEYGFLPVARIPFSNSDPSKPKLLHYELKWDGESHEYLGTLPVFDVEPEIELELFRISKKVLELTELTNYCRIDYRMDQNGLAHMIDLNPNCCLSDESIFNLALKKRGISIEEAIQKILLSCINVPQL